MTAKAHLRDFMKFGGDHFLEIYISWSTKILDPPLCTSEQLKLNLSNRSALACFTKKESIMDCHAGGIELK